MSRLDPSGLRPQGEASFDQFGRRIEYLRISVTDRCNFRCLYCMPQEGLQWLPKSDIFSYEEIAVALNCSTGTVASRLSRGHRLLAARLGPLREAAMAKK